ncbi:adhesion protein FadA [Fusobacterium varium]|uniref:adhesion protein FadA n=1 Tax=Fusobacterium varium TaxID=856 RepID=UPI000BBB31A6|nr:adhesion protein FadA [uncultured Fusobacterium sp.]BBA51920.1 putative adhesion protein FadA [Fusobacterium varium]
MKKILLGCLLLVSAASFGATDVMVTLEQLEQNFQELEAEERAMYNQRKAEAEIAEKVLAEQKATYQQIITQEKRIADVKEFRYYKGQYNQLAKKYADAKRVLEDEMKKQEEIIYMFEIMK